MSARLFWHQGIEYLLFWDTERLSIYSSQVLDLLQSVKNIYADIQLTVPTSSGDLLVITNKQLIYYALIFTKRRDRVWQKVAVESFAETMMQVIECPRSELLILLAEHRIVALNMDRKVQNGQTVSVSLTTHWDVKIKQILTEMAVSQDENYIALRSNDSKVLIWDLEKIPDLFNKSLNLEQFIQINHVISVEEPIRSMKFRSNPQGVMNSLYVVTKSELTIFQEVKLEDRQANFIQLIAVQMGRIDNFIEVTVLRQAQEAQPQAAAVDLRQESVDTVCFEKDGEFLIYELYGLRSNKINSSFKFVKKLNLPGISHIHQIVYRVGDKHSSILCTNNNNLCRILYMYFEDQILQKKYVDYHMQIEAASADENSENIVVRGIQGQLYTIKRYTGWLKPLSTIEQDPIKLTVKMNGKMALYKNILYWIENSKLMALDTSIISQPKSFTYPKAAVRELYFLFSYQSDIYLLCDGELVKVNKQGPTVIKTLIPFNRVLKMEYNPQAQTLLVKFQKWYTLYKLNINPPNVQLEELRKSSRHMIFGGGFWVEIYQTQITFGRGSHKVVSFNISLFLGAISKKHNAKVLFYRIFHLKDEVFQLQIQNYVFFLSIYFDPKVQKYNVSAVRKNKHSMDLLMARLSKNSKPDSYEMLLGVRDYTIKTDSRLVFYGRYLAQPVIQPTKLTQTIQHTISLLNNYVPVHHPRNLKELLLIANFNQVETILMAIYSKLIKQENVEGDFDLGLQAFLEIFNNNSYNQKKVLANCGVQLVSDPDKGRSSELRELEKIIVEDTSKLGLAKNNPLLLSSIVEFCIYRIDNARSLDFFSSVFISQTKNLWANKSRSVTTRDVCWILNSNNKQEAFDSLIEQPLRLKQQSLTWNLLRQYAAIIWFDNIQMIKKWVERIALAQYKKTKDPFDCLLWYILLGKKNIVVALFKKVIEHTKTYEFLLRDFTQPNHKAAASKNAYALLSKKRYEHAVAFFLLAGSLQDAISICLNQLQDIQLAILLCRLSQVDGRPHLQKIYKQNFIGTGEVINDIWIKHIGWYLLGEYVESYNCLYVETFDENLVTYEASKMCCETWKQDFQPELSVFHPSVIIFAEKLKDSFRVKRELQQFEESRKRSNSQDIFESFTDKVEEVVEVKQKSLKSDEKLHVKKSIEYYMLANLPMLALSTFLTYSVHIRDDQNLLAEICFKYVDKLLVGVLKSKKLEHTLERLKTLPEIVKLEKRIDFVEFFEKELKLVDCGEILLEFYFELGAFNKAEEYIIEYSQEVKTLLLRQQTPFKVQTRDEYYNLLHCVWWLQQTLELMIQKNQRFGRLFGQLMVCLHMCKLVFLVRVNETRGLNHLVSDLINACDKVNKNEPFDAIFFKWNTADIEELQLFCPQRRDKYESSKTSKKMDILQEAFRKQQDEQKEVPYAIDDLIIVEWAFETVLLGSLAQKSTLQTWVRQVLTKQREAIETKLYSVADKTKYQTILTEIREVIRQGTFAWTKTVYLNQNTTYDREDVVNRMNMIEAQRWISNRLNSYLSESLKDSKRNTKQTADLKEFIFKNGIQVLKNRTELARTFAINMNESAQNLQLVVLFKKGIKKADVFQSIISRNRSQDGAYLIDQDSVYNAQEPSSPTQKISEIKCQQLNYAMTLLGSDFDRKVELIQSTRKIETQVNSYLKQLQPKPYTDPNELNSIVSHRFLPLFMIGAKTAIDIYNFSGIKNFNRINCPGISEIVKLKTDIANDFIGCADSDGNFCSYRFDNSYSGVPNLQLKKANVADFVYLNSNLLATVSNKDNLLQVYDPLLNPQRNVIFKERVSNVIGLEYAPSTKKIMVFRKSQVSLFDIRRGFLTRFDTLSQNKCSGITSTANRILVGTVQGDIKIFNQQGDELTTLKTFKGLKKPASVHEIRVCRNNIFALSNDGVISYAYYLD